MKKHIYFLFLFLPYILFAQHLDYSRIITPQGQMPYEFEAYIVQLAWYNSPGNQIYKHQIEIAARKVNKTYWEWLKDVTFSFNLNEGNLNKSVGNENLFFPRYNFGTSFNLGEALSRPSNTKIAQEELKMYQLEEQQKMMQVRAETLRRYEDYKLAVDILRSKTQAEQEAENVYQLVLELFQKDKVDFRDFNNASQVFHSTKEARLVAESDVKKAIIALEELIGISWEKALKRRKSREK